MLFQHAYHTVVLLTSTVCVLNYFRCSIDSWYDFGPFWSSLECRVCQWSTRRGIGVILTNTQRRCSWLWVSTVVWLRRHFTNVSNNVFPAHGKRHCFDGLFYAATSRLIFNGIPPTSINDLCTVQSCDAVRTELSYLPDDSILVQTCIVCRQNSQLVTS